MTKKHSCGTIHILNTVYRVFFSAVDIFVHGIPSDHSLVCTHLERKRGEREGRRGRGGGGGGEREREGEGEGETLELVPLCSCMYFHSLTLHVSTIVTALKNP